MDQYPDINLLIGPILIGSLLAYMLIGAYTVQLFHYLTADYIAAARIQLHILVVLVTGIEVTNIVFITQNTWRSLVDGVDHPEIRNVPPTTAPGTPILTGIVACMVQCFFAWRIIVLSRKRPARQWVRFAMTPLIVAVALLQMAAGLTIGGKYVLYHRQIVLTDRLRVPILLHLSGGLVCDTLITISMIYVFWGLKAPAEPSKTKRILNSLVFHSVENGAVVTVFAALNLAFFVSHPHDTIHLCFQYIVGRLYANAMLANLNGRGRRGTDSGNSDSLGEEEVRFHDLSNESRAVFSTESNPRSALYGLTAPKMRTKAEDDDGPGDGIFRLGKKRPDIRVKTPPPAFLVSTVTEVHRDEDIMSRATSRYSDVQSRPQSGDSSNSGY